jgi:hypothetical protein
LNATTKYGVLTVFCGNAKGRLEEVEWMTVRLDSELIMLDFPPDDDTYERSKCYVLFCVTLHTSHGYQREVLFLNNTLFASFISLDKELLRTKERETVCHMARCIQCEVSLSICAPPAGPSADVVLRMHCDAFDTLSKLTKYFIRRSSKANKVFETVR